MERDAPVDGQQLCFDLEAAQWLDGAVAFPVLDLGAEACPGGSPRYRILRSDGSPAPSTVWLFGGAQRTRTDALLIAGVPEGGRLRFESGPQHVWEAVQQLLGTSSTSLRCGAAEVRVPGGALPRDATLTLQEVPSRGAEEGLIAAGTAVRLSPDWRIPARPASLRIAFDPDRYRPERVGIYRWDPLRERWSHEGGTGEGGRSQVEVDLAELGTFRLFEDSAPPEWGRVWPASGSTIRPGKRRVRVEVADRGSGIDWDGVAIELDGRVLESEYDPDRERVDAILRESLSPGEHRLRARAVDRAGNRSTDLEWSFICTRTP